MFLGGELATPAQTIRRTLTGAFLITAAVVLLAVAPLAAIPGILHTEVPGVSVVQQYGGAGLAEAIGIGIGVSIAGLMLCEYVALTRLLHAVGGWRLRPITAAIGGILILAGPISLIDPAGFYDTLLKPSLIAFWLSQLIVFAVYPMFAAKRGQRLLARLGASAFALYGLWTALHSAST